MISSRPGFRFWSSLLFEHLRMPSIISGVWTNTWINSQAVMQMFSTDKLRTAGTRQKIDSMKKAGSETNSKMSSDPGPLWLRSRSKVLVWRYANTEAKVMVIETISWNTLSTAMLISKFALQSSWLLHGSLCRPLRLTCSRLKRREIWRTRSSISWAAARRIFLGSSNCSRRKQPCWSGSGPPLPPASLVDAMTLFLSKTKL